MVIGLLISSGDVPELLEQSPTDLVVTFENAKSHRMDYLVVSDFGRLNELEQVLNERFVVSIHRIHRVQHPNLGLNLNHRMTN